jgi:hypothetical protein
MEPVELRIDQSVIRPIIEARINAAIIDMMHGQEKMISNMISMWMDQKVDSDGKTSGYNANKPRVEWLVQSMLDQAMKSALTDYLSKRKDMLTKEFEKYFKSKIGSSAITAAMNRGLCESLTSDYRVSVSFNAK